LLNVINSHILSVKPLVGKAMSKTPLKKPEGMAEPGQPGQPRRRPTQQRARERVERILAVASRLMAEKGSDAMKMSEIVEGAGVSFGSLYQYFPDKTAIIRVLADRYNDRGRRAVGAQLKTVQTEADLVPALGRITLSYYNFLLTEPVVRDIWAATQADKLLQQVDAADVEYLAGMVREVLLRLRPDADPAALATLARLVMQLVAAAVRYAISIDRAEGDRVIAMFNRSLPADLFSLIDLSERRGARALEA
jgi:AcrR family transcriptional regulator